MTKQKATGKTVCWFASLLECSSRKYPYSPQGRSLKIPREQGPEGWGGRPQNLLLLFVKAGFHMITRIASVTAITRKNVQQSLQSCGNHFVAIVAITAIIWKPAYMETAQRSKSQWPLNFFGNDCTDPNDHMETSLNNTFHFDIIFLYTELICRITQ